MGKGQIERAKQEWEVTVDHLPELVCSLDQAGRIIRANRTVEHWELGSVVEVTGVDFHELLHPDCSLSDCYLKMLWQRALKAAADGGATTVETADPVLKRDLQIDIRPIGRPGVSPTQERVPFVVGIVHDISQRKQTERALQSSEQRYRRLVDDSLGLICTHDLNGTMLSVNPASAELLGYQPDDIVGRNGRDFLEPSVRHLYDAYLKQVRQQPVVSGLMRVMTKSHEVRIWLYRNVRLDEAGKPSYVIGHAQDITDLMRTKRALQQSEARFRALAEGCIQGIVIHRNWQPLFVNQAYARMLGYDTPQDILRLGSIETLIAPHERGSLQTVYQARLQGSAGPIEHEYQGIRKDGRLIWLDNKVTVVDWDGAPAVQSTVFDITHRKDLRAQLDETLAQLRKQRENLLAVFNQMGVGIAIIDADGCIEFLSKAAEQLLPRHSREAKGQPWERVFRLDAAHQAQVNDLCARPRQARTRLSLQLQQAGKQPCAVDLEVLDDPHEARAKIFLLHDRSEVQALRRRLDGRARFQGFLGGSEPMLRLYDLILNLAPVDTTVLIEGETGTGKELVARALHALSKRQAKPFIAVNCAGLGESILDSQLFGHKRGAFTGAIADQRGFFEAANGGTLFLDEIGDIPMPVQTRLLRMLQEREITRLGESKPRKIDVRILAATQHELDDKVREGTFRLDLLYRLRVARIGLPPLRERREDIPLLANAFLHENCAAFDKPIREIRPEAMQRLLEHHWPGNVRELQSAIAYATLHSHGGVLHPNDLPPELSQTVSDEHKLELLTALARARGNRRQAARLLGISKSTLYRRLARYGIGRDT